MLPELNAIKQRFPRSQKAILFLSITLVWVVRGWVTAESTRSCISPRTYTARIWNTDYHEWNGYPTAIYGMSSNMNQYKNTLCDKKSCLWFPAGAQKEQYRLSVLKMVGMNEKSCCAYLLSWRPCVIRKFPCLRIAISNNSQSMKTLRGHKQWEGNEWERSFLGRL